MNAATQLLPPEAPQLYRVFRHNRSAAVEHRGHECVGMVTGRSVLEAVRLFDGRRSWADCQIGPFRFSALDAEYLLEPVFHRRVRAADTPTAPRRRFFVTVSELRQRGLVV